MAPILTDIDNPRTRNCRHLSFCRVQIMIIIKLQDTDVENLRFMTEAVFMQKDRNMYTHSFLPIYKAMHTAIVTIIRGFFVFIAPTPAIYHTCL